MFGVDDVYTWYRNEAEKQAAEDKSGAAAAKAAGWVWDPHGGLARQGAWVPPGMAPAPAPAPLPGQNGAPFSPPDPNDPFGSVDAVKALRAAQGQPGGAGGTAGARAPSGGAGGLAVLGLLGLGAVLLARARR